jgi:hypothetical protein
MSDPNFYNYQTYDTQVGEIGATNVLPTIQGTTEVLPAIGGDFGTGFIQGENTVLQDTAGFGGTTTTTGYLDGTITDANTFFGTTQEYPATTTDNNVFYGGDQVLQATAQPTTYFGDTQVTTDNNVFFTGVTTTDNTALFGTSVVTDGTTLFGENQTNAFQGTTQILPATNVDANTFFAGTTTQIPGTVQNTTTTTTTTQTTYGVNGVSSSPIQAIFGTTQIPTTQVATAVPLNAQTVTTTDVKTNVIPGAVAQNQIIQNQVPVAAQTQGQFRNSNPPQPKPSGARVYDEDFRRGRPVYNDRYSGSKYEIPHILPRPVHKIGANNQDNASKIVGVNQVNPLGVNNINNVGLGINPGLSKLDRGYSYDIRANPQLLNKAGLGLINNNLQPAGQNPKILGNIKDYL